jgi:hypothetical protein
MTEQMHTPLHKINDARDRIADADNLAELIHMSQIGNIKDPEAKAVSHAACLIGEALQEAKGLLEWACDQLRGQSPCNVSIPIVQGAAELEKVTA